MFGLFRFLFGLFRFLFGLFRFCAVMGGSCVLFCAVVAGPRFHSAPSWEYVPPPFGFPSNFKVFRRILRFSVEF